MSDSPVLTRQCVCADHPDAYLYCGCPGCTVARAAKKQPYKPVADCAECDFACCCNKEEPDVGGTCFIPRKP